MRIKPTTNWNSARYSRFLEDIVGINLEDINGTDVEGISGIGVNILDTGWVTPREIGQGLWQETIFPWKVDFFPWLFGPVSTDWLTPRYDTFLEDINGINLFDLASVALEGISGNRVNAIDTLWQ